MQNFPEAPSPIFLSGCLPIIWVLLHSHRCCCTTAHFYSSTDASAAVVVVVDAILTKLEFSLVYMVTSGTHWHWLQQAETARNWYIIWTLERAHCDCCHAHGILHKLKLNCYILCMLPRKRPLSISLSWALNRTGWWWWMPARCRLLLLWLYVFNDRSHNSNKFWLFPNWLLYRWW